MIAFVWLLAISSVLFSCRTARNLVEVQDDRVVPTQPSDDYLHIESSMNSSLTITALSLPSDKKAIDWLELSLREPGTRAEIYSQKPYKTGQSLKIKAYSDYEWILNAWSGDRVLYSTDYCSNPPKFHAEMGDNKFTASLCAKPTSP